MAFCEPSQNMKTPLRVSCKDYDIINAIDCYRLSLIGSNHDNSHVICLKDCYRLLWIVIDCYRWGNRIIHRNIRNRCECHWVAIFGRELRYLYLTPGSRKITPCLLLLQHVQCPLHLWICSKASIRYSPAIYFVFTVC